MPLTLQQILQYGYVDPDGTVKIKTGLDTPPTDAKTYLKLLP